MTIETADAENDPLRRLMGAEEGDQQALIDVKTTHVSLEPYMRCRFDPDTASATADLRVLCTSA